MDKAIIRSCKIIFFPLVLTFILLLASSAAYGSSESEVTIMFTGDLMCQPAQQTAAFDGE